ncbi:hypothetical protein SNN83_001966 [Cronobacter malonaticus]|nr:hypothetical protein [Cronobacter malonaticus]
MTHYRWSYSKSFMACMPHFTLDEKSKVADFLVTYQDYGLNDFSLYPGKIARTGSGECTKEERDFAFRNNLWHYHVGIPKYVQSSFGNYMTSRDVLHFQWFQDENHIRLVDMYRHYLYDGKFYMPSEKELEPAVPEKIMGGAEANDDGGDLPEAG